jgi:thymidylate kinase
MSTSLSATTGWLRFHLSELAMLLRPPVPWLAVLGPDGSGKSTALAGIRDAWPPALGPVHTYHLRPRLLTRRGGSSEPVVDPHGQPPRGQMMSTASLIFVMMDWWIGYWTVVARQRAKHGLVVFDRHMLDVLVDPLRYRYAGPRWLARAACRLVPRPDVIVVLDATPEVVRARKEEVTAAESRRQALAYRRLAADTGGVHLVDATQSSEQVLEAIMAILYRKMQSGRSRSAGLRPHGT